MTNSIAVTLRDLSSFLMNNDLEESIRIQSIQEKLLSIADDLDHKKQEISIKDDDIDDLLDEIEEKEKEEFDIKLVNDTGKLFDTLTRDNWIPLLRVFGCVYDDKESLLALYDSIPQKLKNAIAEYHSLFSEPSDNITRWLVRHKSDSKINHIVYKSIMRYACNYKLKHMSTVKDATAFYTKYKRFIDLNYCDNSRGRTLLHHFVKDEDEAMIKWILLQPGVDDRIVDKDGRTAMDIAKDEGKSIIVTALIFGKMGNKMRQKSDQQVAKLKRNNGMVKQWFRFYKTESKQSDEYKSMQKMIETLKILIEKRLPISDDLLLLCFHFELAQNNNNTLQCSLWKCLYNTLLNETLTIPLNTRNWQWFKQYVFNSCLWYKKVGSNQKLLYDLLIEMVSKQLKTQRNYLQPYIDELEKKSNDDDESWEKLKNFKQFIVTKNPLRQDECIEIGTNKELLPFPIRPLFSNHQLLALNERVTEFDCHHHYDVHGYLSNLMLTAHSLNETFHNAMKMIFEIDEDSGHNVENGLVYHMGPVKRSERSQAKAETDYAHCSYPTTARIIDFIRCCLVYRNPRDLLNGIDKFMKDVDISDRAENLYPFCPETRVDKNRNMNKRSFVTCCRAMRKDSVVDFVGKDDLIEGYSAKRLTESPYSTQCKMCEKTFNKDSKENIYWCVHELEQSIGGIDCMFNMICMECGDKQIAKRFCLKKILRLKNMFLENKRENDDSWDLYKYADIKMGVLMQYNGQSMIVEVQFLLDFMLKAKSLGHGLYEIERNKDFIGDVNTIMNVAGDAASVDKKVHEAVIKGRHNELATLILNESPLDLTMKSKTLGLIHWAALYGHKKILKLLLDTMQSDANHQEFEKFINMQSDGKMESALHICQRENDVSNFKFLLSYKQIDVNARNKENKTVLYEAVDALTNRKGRAIFDLLQNDPRCDLNVANVKGVSLFFSACSNCMDMGFITKLWQTGYFDINEFTLLKSAVQQQNVELIQFLLNIPNIDVNTVADGETACDKALREYFCPLRPKEMLRIANMIRNHPNYDWKIGKNKLYTVCNGGNATIDDIKYILNLYPEIDINQLNHPEIGRAFIFEAIRFDTDTLLFVLNLPGIDVDLCDKNGYTPWLHAVKCINAYSHMHGAHNFDNLKLLYKNNRDDINIHHVNEDGKNALELAIKHDAPQEVIDWLTLIGLQEQDKKVHTVYEDPNATWFYLNDAQENVGPMTIEDIKDLKRNAKITSYNYVYNANTMENWMMICRVPELEDPMDTIWASLEMIQSVDETDTPNKFLKSFSESIEFALEECDVIVKQNFANQYCQRILGLFKERFENYISDENLDNFYVCYEIMLLCAYHGVLDGIDKYGMKDLYLTVFKKKDLAKLYVKLILSMQSDLSIPLLRIENCEPTTHNQDAINVWKMSWMNDKMEEFDMSAEIIDYYILLNMDQILIQMLNLEKTKFMKYLEKNENNYIVNKIKCYLYCIYNRYQKLQNEYINTLIPFFFSKQLAIITTGFLMNKITDDEEMIQYITNINMDSINKGSVCLNKNWESWKTENNIQQELKKSNVALIKVTIIGDGTLLRCKEGAMEFDVFPYDTILSIKSKYFRKTDIPIEQLQFWCTGMRLENEKIIADYNITQESKIVFMRDRQDMF